MSSSVLIVALVLMVAGGVIAYLGDMIGKRLGKRRVSVFGLRPRSTAILISATTGVVIALLSLGVMLGLFGTVREALLHYDDLKRNIQSAEVQLSDTQALLTEAQRAAEDADERHKEAEERLRASEEAVAEAEQSREVVEQDLAQTRQGLVITEGKLEHAQTRLSSTQVALAEKEEKLGVVEFSLQTTQAQLEDKVSSLREITEYYSIEMLRDRPGAFLEGEELARTVLTAGMAEDEIRAALVDLKAKADRAAEAGGAAPIAALDEDARFTIFAYEEDANAEEGQPVLSPNRAARERLYAQAAAEFARELDVSDWVIVKINAKFDSVEGRPVLVELVGGPIRRILAAGEELARGAISSALSFDEIVTQLQRLAERASWAALEKGMPIPPGGSFGSLRLGEINRLVTEIQSRQGEVTVIVRSAKDTTNIDDLEPQFVIAE